MQLWMAASANRNTVTLRLRVELLFRKSCYDALDNSTCQDVASLLSLITGRAGSINAT